MKILTIFAAGLIILVIAILANALAQKLGLATWYDLLKSGTKITILEAVWLFIVYPFLLGFAAYVASKMFK